ncbi:MAG: carbohydrate ABC transporter permease, partial [Bacteroidota bacterium]
MMAATRPIALKKALSYGGLLAVAFVLLLPFAWMVSTSLKGNEAIFAIPPQWIPETFRWDNYAEVFERMPFLLYLRNTTVITVFTIIGTVG